MKNKWFLLTLLIILINNKTFSQFPNNLLKKAISYRNINIIFLDDDFWRNDSVDILFSLEKEKIYNEKIRGERLIKADNKKIDSLIKIAKKGNYDERSSALYDLRKIDSKRQIPFIEKMVLKDNSAMIRYYCIDILYDLNSVNSIPVLIKALKDKNIEVRNNAAFKLALFGEKEYSLVILKKMWLSDSLKILCHSAFEDINTQEVIQMLRTDMQHKNPYIAVNAALTLAILNYKDEAYIKLKELLNNEDIKIKKCAMYDLAYYVGGENVYNLLKDYVFNTAEVAPDNKELIEYGYRILNKYFKKYIKK